jgi:hypothetical protein
MMMATLGSTINRASTIKPAARSLSLRCGVGFLFLVAHVRT